VKITKHVSLQGVAGFIGSNLFETRFYLISEWMALTNMLVAARDAGVKRFVYAASSSTYGAHPGLPKVEDIISNPLSPYAVTGIVNLV
jgi:nucleoside-diphosphate-sugar epimerase